MVEKSLFSGTISMIVLKLLSEQDRYGLQIIEVLAKRSNKAIELKTGTLYPLLHQLENRGYITSYNKTSFSGKIRKYYHLTHAGRFFLDTCQQDWEDYVTIVYHILNTSN